MAIGFPSGTASLTLTNLNNGFATTGTPSYVNVVGMDISPTGDRVFLASRDTDSVYRYDLSTPFDFTTASHVQTLSLSGINPYGIKFNPTGNRLFVLNSNGPVLQWIGTGPYSLSTGGAWQSYNYGTANMGNTRGIAFNTDGTKMTVLTYGGTTGIHEFDLTTGFDPSTATYNSVYFNTAPYMTVPMNHWFNSTGTKLYVANNSGPKIHTFYLATPFDISSSNITVGPISNSAPGSGEQHQHVFNANETELYVIKSGTAASGSIISMSFVETSGVQDGDEFTFNNRDYIYDGTKEAWEVNSPITVAQTGSPVSDLSELSDSTSILSDPANEVLTYADLDAILAVTSPATGQLAFNLDTSDMYIFGGTNWQKVYDEDDVPVVVPFNGDRGITAGNGSNGNMIEYWDISGTSGQTAASFGSLSFGRPTNFGMTGSSVTGLIPTANHISQNGVVDYITIATPGNSADFGDLTDTRIFPAACSDGTTALYGGGGIDGNPGTGQTTIDSLTISTPGQATSFGNLTQARYLGSACSDGTYGVWNGGRAFSNQSSLSSMEYVTIQTQGNGQTFGNLLVASRYNTAIGGPTYGYIAGNGDVNSDDIEYITIATPGNSASFGNMTATLQQHAGTGNNDYGCFVGGYDGTNNVSVSTIQRFAFGTSGNASSFGDLPTTRNGHDALSGAAA